MVKLDVKVFLRTSNKKWWISSYLAMHGGCKSTVCWDPESLISFSQIPLPFLWLVTCSFHWTRRGRSITVYSPGAFENDPCFRSYQWCVLLNNPVTLYFLNVASNFISWRTEEIDLKYPNWLGVWCQSILDLATTEVAILLSAFSMLSTIWYITSLSLLILWTTF